MSKPWWWCTADPEKCEYRKHGAVNSDDPESCRFCPHRDVYGGREAFSAEQEGKADDPS